MTRLRVTRVSNETITFNFKNFESSKMGEEFYDIFNELYFGNKLPTVRVGFFTKKDDTSYGFTLRVKGARFPSYICLNPYFTEWGKTLRATLLHEMVHVKLMNRGGHGPKFKKEMRRLILIGAFDDLL